MLGFPDVQTGNWRIMEMKKKVDGYENYEEF